VRLIVWPLLSEFLHGSFRLLLRVFIIVVPIMVVLELFEGSRPFRRLVRLWARLMKPLGMTEEIATPTFVGFLFGIAYGSGVIIRETRRRRVPRRQVFLMSAFLSQVHAIVEDSLVFIALGAAALWMVGFRLIWASAGGPRVGGGGARGGPGRGDRASGRGRRGRGPSRMGAGRRPRRATWRRPRRVIREQPGRATRQQPRRARVSRVSTGYC
jgi:hypothetical protein